MPDTGLLCDILWSDPKSTETKWEENERGVSFTFNEEVVDDFCQKNDIDLICRGHLVVDDGYEFFADRKLITIFSAPNYCGMFENDGCLMKVAEDLTCSFSILKPQRIPEYKVCLLTAEDVGPPQNTKLLKEFLKQRPEKKELEKNNPSIYAEEHQISMKTNKGAQHINTWIKSNGLFESDDALESFLAQAEGLLVMLSVVDRITYQDIPKFIIYAMQTQVI